MIIEITENKKQFIGLLLLADEQEDMIDNYLERGNMYALYHQNTVISVCVVTDEGNGILEIKNLATDPNFWRMGFATKLVKFIICKYKDIYDILIVGTGDSPLTLPFYEKCGFVQSHRIKNFFIDNYDHPIFEGGKQLIDMIYLKMSL